MKWRYLPSERRKRHQRVKYLIAEIHACFNEIRWNGYHSAIAIYGADRVNKCMRGWPA